MGRAPIERAPMRRAPMGITPMERPRMGMDTMGRVPMRRNGRNGLNGMRPNGKGPKYKVSIENGPYIKVPGKDSNENPQ